MEQKQRFVSLLKSNAFSMVELCESFGISRKTEHEKWGQAKYFDIWRSATVFMESFVGSDRWYDAPPLDSDEGRIRTLS